MSFALSSEDYSAETPGSEGETKPLGAARRTGPAGSHSMNIPFQEQLPWRVTLYLFAVVRGRKLVSRDWTMFQLPSVSGSRFCARVNRALEPLLPSPVAPPPPPLFPPAPENKRPLKTESKPRAHSPAAKKIWINFAPKRRLALALP